MHTLATELIRLLAEIVGADPGKILPDKCFAEQSIGASDLRDFADRVQRKYGVPAPNLLWDVPSLDALQTYLARSLDTKAPAERLDTFVNLGFKEGLPDYLFYE